MYVLLLLLGALATALGLSLVATGVTAGGESEVITPGTIAAVGGLALIGLGLVLRELQRIEHALASRPMPRLPRPVDAPAAGAERASAQPRIPAQVAPKPEPRPQPAAPSLAAPPALPTPPAAAEDAALERLREKFPTLVRLDNAPVVEETDASLLPQVRPERVEETIPEINNVHVAARANGSVPARVIPSVEGRPRKSATPERQKGSVFEAFWPSGQRRRTGQTVPAQGAAPASSVDEEPQALAETPPASEVTPEVQPVVEPNPTANEAATSPPVSILKSGVVEGMAYALYSDGSIEAQLPQGRLRFGSITELRNHIDSVS